MTHFEIDSTLQRDCHHMGSFGLSEVLLHRNSALMWFILVPRVTVMELYQLKVEQRRVLMDESDRLAIFLKTNFPCNKINVAAIGNVVAQLHVHVVARYRGDPCWPDVVWGRLPAVAERSECEVEDLRNQLAFELELGCDINGDPEANRSLGPGNDFLD